MWSPLGPRGWAAVARPAEGRWGSCLTHLAVGRAVGLVALDLALSVLTHLRVGEDIRLTRSAPPPPHGGVSPGHAHQYARELFHTHILELPHFCARELCQIVPSPCEKLLVRSDIVPSGLAIPKGSVN